MKKIKAENIIFKDDFNIVHGVDGDYYIAEYKNLDQVLNTIFRVINKINWQVKELKLGKDKDMEFVDERQFTDEDKRLIENIVKRMAMTEVARYMKYLNQEKLKPKKDDYFKKQYPDWLNNVSNNTPFSIETCKRVYNTLGEIKCVVGRNQQRLETMNQMANMCAIPPNLMAEFLVKYIKTTK